MPVTKQVQRKGFAINRVSANGAPHRVTVVSTTGNEHLLMDFDDAKRADEAYAALRDGLISWSGAGSSRKC
jgi:Holliday junction resolvase